MLKTGTGEGKAGKKEIPVTPGEAAAILQSAVSYCLDAGLQISWMINDSDAGKCQLWFVVEGLTAEEDVRGRLVIEPASITTVTGSESSDKDEKESVDVKAP